LVGAGKRRQKEEGSCQVAVGMAWNETFEKVENTAGNQIW